MLRAQTLSKIYPDPSGAVTALEGFSYSFKPGRLSVIMGPSGSGKSTLLNLLAGFDVPSSGSVFLGDEEISGLNENARAELRLHKFGFVFQSYNLITVLTASQNVAFPLGLAGVKERQARAEDLLNRFGLSHRLHHLPHKLSGGEKQRVSIARALANNPDVIFADEPTGNLDSKSGATVIEVLRDVALEGRSVIVVTHDPRVGDKADEVLVLEDGALQDKRVRVP